MQSSVQETTFVPFKKERERERERETTFVDPQMLKLLNSCYCLHILRCSYEL
jgi:hypothetical protein